MPEYIRNVFAHLRAKRKRQDFQVGLLREIYARNAKIGSRGGKNDAVTTLGLGAIERIVGAFQQ